MNKTLQSTAREAIKEGLSKLPEDWQDKFKRMYGHPDISRSIGEIVDTMKVENLDWALTQVENSLKKLNKVT